ncbi:MAG TPA: DUF6457 domain-containing protein [Solirubrobacteraceae bacterium]|nr:DUF6457 domain-containing protein [Solirubrobacteraceae bacterium]
MNAREWLAAYAEKLGTTPPSNEEFKTLLDVAAEAAHSSERVAAPVACWLVARAGVEPEEALRLARDVGSSSDG